MKKRMIIVVAMSLLAITKVSAQETDSDEKKSGGFKKENLFTGGTVALGFGSGTTSLGLGPHFGYSINKYVDVALSVDYNYLSQRDYFTTTKYRQSILSPGAFVRIYPVKFLFAHAQFEQNFIQLKTKYDGFPDDKYNYNVSSFLVGPGYASGRGDGNVFFYISVLWDLARNTGSPYVDNLGRANPILRAGVNVALFQGSREGGMRRRNSRNMY